MKIVLASASVARKNILNRFFDNITIAPSSVDERAIDKETPSSYVLRISKLKGKKVAEKYSENLVIAADTVVVKNSIILGKPLSKRNGMKMLNLLNNSEHEVLTGVFLKYATIEINFLQSTKVLFWDIPNILLEKYVDTEEGIDKAGGYAIQGLGSFMVKQINGDYENVVGLPISTIIKKIMLNNLVSPDFFLSKKYKKGSF